MTVLIYAAAALFEIAGCFSVWAWLRLGRSAWWLVPGAVALALFAWLLTRVEAEAAGRAYAAYGGLYIVASRKSKGVPATGRRSPVGIWASSTARNASAATVTR